MSAVPRHSAFIIMTLSIMAFGIMNLSIIDLIVILMTLSIMVFGNVTKSIMGLTDRLNCARNTTQH
jgi:hypothetical protein